MTLKLFYNFKQSSTMKKHHESDVYFTDFQYYFDALSQASQGISLFPNLNQDVENK